MTSALDVAELAPLPSEVTETPAKGRRWSEEIRGTVRERLLRGEIGPLTAAHAIRDLERFPIMVGRAGIADPPYAGSLWQPEHVLAYKASPIWTLTTKRPALSTLRTHLRAVGNPIAAQKALWRLPRGKAVRRWWITREQMAEIYEVSEGRGRVHVALQGFNGLRECELRTLTWPRVTLEGSMPTLALIGKGRFGGTPRTIPMTPTTRAVLGEWDSGSDRVYPLGHAQAHRELAALGKKAGIGVPVSGHVLRRSFGRIAYQAGVPLVDIQHVYGHESIEMTAYYIGVDEDSMAAGLARFDAFVRSGREA